MRRVICGRMGEMLFFSCLNTQRLGIGGISFQSNELKHVKQQKATAIYYKWRTTESHFVEKWVSAGEWNKNPHFPPTWLEGMMALTSSVWRADKIGLFLKSFVLGILQEYSRNSDKSSKKYKSNHDNNRKQHKTK